jgi:large subunit ribosomal protein L29
MASTKNNLKEMTLEALGADIAQAKQELARIKFDHASKGVADPKLIGQAKKEVARMLTEVRAREISSMTPEQLAKRSNIRLRRK